MVVSKKHTTCARLKTNSRMRMYIPPVVVCEYFESDDDDYSDAFEAEELYTPERTLTSTELYAVCGGTVLRDHLALSSII